MSDVKLIDANALKEKFSNMYRDDYEKWIKAIIDNAPTLPNPCGNPCNFTRPTGEWVHDYDDFYHCSICKRGICTEWQSNPSKYYPYCHCGAKMKEAENEQV